MLIVTKGAPGLCLNYFTLLFPLPSMCFHNLATVSALAALRLQHRNCIVHPCLQCFQKLVCMQVISRHHAARMPPQQLGILWQVGFASVRSTAMHNRSLNYACVPHYTDWAAASAAVGAQHDECMTTCLKILIVLGLLVSDMCSLLSCTLRKVGFMLVCHCSLPIHTYRLLMSSLHAFSSFKCDFCVCQISHLLLSSHVCTCI